MHMNRGFTVVEITVVVIVLSILVTLVGAGASQMLKTSRTAEAKSEMMVIKSALERYYSKNNEYPSMQQLTGGENGRNLSDAQYANIAALLGVRVDALKGGDYSFMPCWTGSTVCCGPVGLHTCITPESDNKYIRYYTRTSSDVAAGNVARTYNAYSSGCTYTFPAPAQPEDNGYTAYFLMYQDQTDTNWWTATRVHSSDRGKTTRGDWCIVNKQD